MEIRGLSFVAIALAIACFALALALGRTQEKRTDSSFPRMREPSS